MKIKETINENLINKFLNYDLSKLTDAIEKLSNSIKEYNLIESKKLILEQKKFLNEKHIK